MKPTSSLMAAPAAAFVAGARIDPGLVVKRDKARKTAKKASAPRPAGTKALKAYRTRYTHVMSAMATDANLARLANKRKEA